MIERSMEVKTFFDTRSTALFVQTASRFSSRIMIRVGDRVANAKSIMGVISLGLEDGQTATLTADGDDESQVIPALEQFFRSNATA